MSLKELKKIIISDVEPSLRETYNKRFALFNKIESHENDEFFALIEQLEERLKKLDNDRIKKHMKTGNTTLPNGIALTAPSGGYYAIGTDFYPVTIIGFSESRRRLYYRRAVYCRQKEDFRDDTDAEIQTATYRKKGFYRPLGSPCGFIGTGGYVHQMDPSF